MARPRKYSEETCREIRKAYGKKGGPTAGDIARRLGMPVGSVHWICRDIPSGSGQVGRPGKLTPDQILWVRKRIDAGESTTDIARAYGVSRRTIRRIVNGESYKGVADVPVSTDPE
tara:strand:- start:29304 stop:29651 length:348 start_codon:yes stop_codon:yes gene_type:complete